MAGPGGELQGWKGMGRERRGLGECEVEALGRFPNVPVREGGWCGRDDGGMWGSYDR